MSFYETFVAIAPGKCQTLEQITQEQSASHLRHDSRKVRITASTAKKVPIRGNPQHFLREHIYPRSPPGSSDSGSRTLFAALILGWRPLLATSASPPGVVRFRISPPPLLRPSWLLPSLRLRLPCYLLPLRALGRPFIPPATVAVSSRLRSNILQGKDVNLASLLLPSPVVDRQMVDCGDAFPDRREELDLYLSMLADFSKHYGGMLFYEYHKAFSAKAASYIFLYNSRLDWSITDTELLVRHFGGHCALDCAVCGSQSLFCPLPYNLRCCSCACCPQC
ncbi:hypothetical protein AOLI_G00093590 [Acnodon oligacanthus]